MRETTEGGGYEEGEVGGEEEGKELNVWSRCRAI